MKAIKVLVKKILRLDSQSNLTPIKNLTYVGSEKWGYQVPGNYLTASSICYCVGAGLDVSLDIELATRFGAQVFIFDPMPYAADYFNELVNKTKNNEEFRSVHDPAYIYKISSEQIDTIRFIKTGLWNEKMNIKFYSPVEESYAGHSILNLQNTDNYIEAPVNTLKNIMSELNHQHIDLLKLEIEGSEYAVIDNIVKDKLDIKIILVEFDEFHHRKGKNMSTLWRIKQTSEKLYKAGYKLVHSTNLYKRTFIRNDIFRLLQNQA